MWISIPLLCLSPVKVTNVNFGTSSMHMNATTFFGTNEVLLQNVHPALPSNMLLLANLNPSLDVTRKTFDLDDAKALHLNKEMAVENLDVDSAKVIAQDESKDTDFVTHDDDWYFNEYVVTGRTLDRCTICTCQLTIG
jgi:hypothetical protein